MGPKNGHMTQEVLIRVFPGFTHAQRKKQFSFYQGCKAGEDAHSSGWPHWRRILAEDEVRPAVRGRERLVGQREEAEGRGTERDLVLATRSLHPRRALCLPSQPCAAWPRACSAKPTRAWGGDRSFLSPRGTDSGTHLVFNEYLSDQRGMTDEWANDYENKKNHTEETLFPLYLTRRTVPS